MYLRAHRCTPCEVPSTRHPHVPPRNPCPDGAAAQRTLLLGAGTAWFLEAPPGRVCPRGGVSEAQWRSAPCRRPTAGLRIRCDKGTTDRPCRESRETGISSGHRDTQGATCCHGTTSKTRAQGRLLRDPKRRQGLWTRAGSWTHSMIKARVCRVLEWQECELSHSLPCLPSSS